MITDNLPLIFAALLGLSILIYVILDGFDLGVGLLFPFADEGERDRMIASIGPFWDANETWLVLAVGILLVAFPAAHGAILTALYLPVFVMLVGLILRGVAFEFRAKAPAAQKRGWDRAFFAGSLMASAAQGYMLGLYIMGLEPTLGHVGFALLIGGALTVAYSFIGAVWLVGKSEGALFAKALSWAKGGIWGAVLGLGAVSLATPFVSARIAEKWLSWPAAAYLAPLPIASLALMAVIFFSLRRLRRAPANHSHWTPFFATSALFACGFGGMAYSFFPYIVPEKLTIAQAASAPESLIIILWGVAVVLPIIIAYSALSYVIFRGKARGLRYD